MAFQGHYTSKFKEMLTAAAAAAAETRILLQCLPTRLPEIANAAFETPITPGEVQLAVTQGKKKKITWT
jgi:hypothetical protein